MPNNEVKIQFTADGSQTITESNKVSQGIKEIGEIATKVFGLLGIAMSGGALFELGKEAVMAASQYESLGVTMEVLGNTAGYTSGKMREFEDSLSKAGIIGTDARKSLALMAENHVDLAHAAGLATVAQNAAAVAGISVSEAMERIAFSVDTGNARTLRSMNLTINYTKAYKDYADSIGKNVKQLNEYELVEARVQAVLKKRVDIEGAYQAALGTTSGQIREVKKNWAELLETAGADAQSPLLSLLTEVNSTMELVKSHFNDIKAVSNGLLATGAVVFFGRLTASIEPVTAAMVRYTTSMLQGNVVTLGGRTAIAQMAAAEMEAAQAKLRQAEATTLSTEATIQATAVEQRYWEQISSTALPLGLRRSQINQQLALSTTALTEAEAANAAAIEANALASTELAVKTVALTY